MKRRGFVRRVILPFLWLVIGLAVAGSLVKLAFLDGAAGLADDSLQPTGEAPSETVPVETGTVDNTLVVDGTIEMDPARPVAATIDGEFIHAFVGAGDMVHEGERIFQIRTEVIPEPTFEESEPESELEGEEAEPPPLAAEPEPTYTYTDIYAPVSGRLSGFALTIGDEVTRGTAMASVQPHTFKAVGSITPLDRYRLLDHPKKAQISIKGGPKPFTCHRLAIGDSATQAASGSPDEGFGEEGLEAGGGDAATTITCRIPDGVTVFDGLSMSMEIAAGSAKDVLVVPVTAVRGLLGTGSVWVLDENGLETERQVGLGVTDGKVVAVTSGLQAGDMVLLYVPGSEGQSEEEMMIEGEVMY